MNMLLEQLSSQQLLTEDIINYAKEWHEYAPILYLTQLKLALVFCALWIVVLYHGDTKFWGKK